MFRKIFLVLAFACSPALALDLFSVATVPACGAQEAFSYAVFDAASGASCTVGGGSTYLECVCLNGTVYVVAPLTISTSRINDADNDTYVDTELNPDEDLIRFGVGGTERALLDGDGDLQIDGDLTVSGGDIKGGGDLTQRPGTNADDPMFFMGGSGGGDPYLVAFYPNPPITNSTSWMEIYDDHIVEGISAGNTWNVCTGESDGLVCVATIDHDGNFTTDDQGEIRSSELDANGSSYAGFKAPASLTANRICTLQDAAAPIPDSCVGDGVDGATLVVEEDNSTVDGAATNLDFTEPDTTLVTSSPAGEANVDMSKYALLEGRSSGQTLSGGETSTEDLTLEANDEANQPFIQLNGDSTIVIDNDAVSDKTIFVNVAAGTNGALVINKNLGQAVTIGEGSVTMKLDEGAGNATPLSFEGATANSSETTVAVTDPTADRMITLPDETGTVCTTGSLCSGYGDIIGVWTDSSGDVSALVAGAGDTLDATGADSTKPNESSTTLPATCTEGETYQDTDSAGCEVYVCVATDQWAKFACDGGGAGHGVELTHSTTFTHNSTGNYLILPWNTETRDTDGYYSGSSGLITVPAGLDGLYAVTCSVVWDTNTTGNREIVISQGRSASAIGRAGSNGSATTSKRQSAAAHWYALAGDTFDCYAMQNSGGNRTMDLTKVNGGHLSAFLVQANTRGIVGDHGVQLSQSGTQSVNDSSETAITFETETVDTDDYHAASADSIIVPSGLGGQATIVCSLEFATNGTGLREARLFKNGSEIDHDTRVALSSDVTTPRVVYHDMAAAQASDYECRAYQTSGGALNVNATGTVFAFLMVNADEADVKREASSDRPFYDKDGDGTHDTLHEYYVDGAPYDQYDPDRPPSSCAICDEFTNDTASLTWTWGNQDSSTLTVDLDSYRIAGDTAANEIHARATDSPSSGNTDFTVTAKFQISVAASNDGCGLGIIESGTIATPTRVTDVAVYENGATDLVEWRTATNYAFGSLSSIGSAAINLNGVYQAFPLFLQIRYTDSSRATTAHFSTNGFDWSQIGSSRTASADPPFFFVSADDGGGCRFEWVRARTDSNRNLASD